MALAIFFYPHLLYIYITVPSRVVVEAGTSETKTETWVAETKRPSKLGRETSLKTEASSQDPVDKAGTSGTS